MPWIGSLGLMPDLKQMLTARCEGAGTEHPEWDPATRFPAWEGGETAFHGSCGKCRARGRQRLLDRGVPEETVRHYFRLLSLPYQWGKERNVEPKGLEAIELAGGSYLDYMRRKDEKRAKDQAPDPIKLGSHLVPVAELTDEHRAHNTRHEQAWNEAVAKRATLRKKGMSLREARQSAPLPIEDPYYVVADQK